MKSVKIRLLERAKKTRGEVLGIALMDFPEWKGKEVLISEEVEYGVKKLIITEVMPLSNKDLKEHSRKTVFIRIN